MKISPECKAAAKRKYKVWPSAYASGYGVKCTKAGGPTMKSSSKGDLGRWFDEKWIDIKTGKPCGRSEGEKRNGYPACRPSKRISKDTPTTASELTKSEKESFKRKKTSSKNVGKIKKGSKK